MGKLQHVRAFRGKERVAMQVIECCVYMAWRLWRRERKKCCRRKKKKKDCRRFECGGGGKTVDGWCVKLDPLPRWRLLSFFFNFCQFVPWVFGVIPSSNSSMTLPPFRYGYLQAKSICSSTPSSPPLVQWVHSQRKKRKPVQFQNKEEKKSQQIPKKTFALGNFYF